MARTRITNAAQTYKKKYLNGNKGQFFIDDYMEVIKLTMLPDRSQFGNMLDAVEISLRGGFIIGYRCAQRDYKKGK